LTPFAPYGFNAIFQASKIVVFGFFGFEAVASLYNSIQKPEKNISKAITYSILLVSALYFVFVFSTLVGLPRELFLSGRTLPEALYAMFPEKPWLITLTVWGIIITLMGTLHAMIWSISSLIRSLSTLNYKASVVVVTLLVWLSSVIFKSLDLLFNITALCIIVALVAAIMPLLTKHVPARISERIIAFFALISSTIMCAYAVEGIWRQLANGL
jgi:amino acid transporter